MPANKRLTIKSCNSWAGYEYETIKKANESSIKVRSILSSNKFIISLY